LKFSLLRRGQINNFSTLVAACLDFEGDELPVIGAIECVTHLWFEPPLT